MTSIIGSKSSFYQRGSSYNLKTNTFNNNQKIKKYTVLVVRNPIIERDKGRAGERNKKRDNHVAIPNLLLNLQRVREDEVGSKKKGGYFAFISFHFQIFFKNPQKVHHLRTLWWGRLQEVTRERQKKS